MLEIRFSGAIHKLANARKGNVGVISKDRYNYWGILALGGKSLRFVFIFIYELHLVSEHD